MHRFFGMPNIFAAKSLIKKTSTVVRAILKSLERIFFESVLLEEKSLTLTYDFYHFMIKCFIKKVVMSGGVVSRLKKMMCTSYYSLNISPTNCCV